MNRINLYVHYDTVTNHVMTRAINLLPDDFTKNNFPKNIILDKEPRNFGRFDSQTNFKIIRGQDSIRNYMEITNQTNGKISNWIDFDTIETMRSLEPSEVAELLYLFHTSRSIRSAFFYKLQNNYVYLTLPNGLNKTYYRYITDFYPRISRVIQEEMTMLANEGRYFFFMRKERLSKVPESIIKQIAPLFQEGLKINFAQSYMMGTKHFVPLNIIEDNLMALTIDQRPKDHVGFLIYDMNAEQWAVDIVKES